MKCGYCGGDLDDAHGQPVVMGGVTIQGCPRHPLSPQMTYINPPKWLEAANKLKALIAELRRIMTQLTDAAVLEQLQEAIDTAES